MLMTTSPITATVVSVYPPETYTTPTTVPHIAEVHRPDPTRTEQLLALNLAGDCSHFVEGSTALIGQDCGSTSSFSVPGGAQSTRIVVEIATENAARLQVLRGITLVEASDAEIEELSA